MRVQLKRKQATLSIYNFVFNKFIISKKNLIANVNKTKQNNKNALVCAMVKANAYGVGVKEVVKTLSPYVDFFGVAFAFEAEKVKKLCNTKVLVVGALEKGKLNSQISYTCNSLKDVDYLIRQNIPLNVHLKVNTGMNRFGFNSIKDFWLALLKIKNSLLNLEGVFTHFATDDDYVDKQKQKFSRFMRVCKKLNFKPIFHADNSLVSQFKNHNLDMVRIGFNLYNNINFNPVVEIESQIVQINKVKKNQLVGYNYRFVAEQNMKVAIVPLGYADGFSLKYIGLKLMVGKQMCRVLNVCMDCFMLDVSNANIQVGDKVQILGKDNPLSIYAQHAKINEYEVMTSFSPARAKRILK